MFKAVMAIAFFSVGILFAMEPSKQLAFAAKFNPEGIAERVSQEKVVLPYLQTEENSLKKFTVNLGVSGNITRKTDIFFKEDSKFIYAHFKSDKEIKGKLSQDNFEKALKNIDEEVLGVGDVGDSFMLGSFWEKITKSVAFEEAKEYQIMPMNYRFANGEKKQVIVLKVWGVRNPFDMPEDIPDHLKNKARIIFNLDGTVISKDNLL